MLGRVEAGLLLLGGDAQHAEHLEDEEEGDHVGRDPGEDGEDAADLRASERGNTVRKRAITLQLSDTTKDLSG